MSARLLLDANLSPETAAYLRGLNHHVESVQELGWGNLTDEEIVEKAIRSNQVLITFDRDFSQTWYLSKHGELSVIWLRIREQKVDHVNEVLGDTLEVIRTKELAGSLTVVSEKGYKTIRW